jgi:SAM-dependent methyltransferase
MGECRVCRSELSSQKVLDLSVRNSTITVPFFLCNYCGNASAGEVVDEELLLERHSNNHSWIFEERRKAKFFKYRERQQREQDKTVASKVVSRLPHECRFLDVGCAEGTYLNRIRTLAPQWNVQGIEVDKNSSAWGQSKGRPIINAAYSKDSFDENSKDAISIHEALDHFNDLHAVFDCFRYHLRTDGHLTVINSVFDWDREQERDKFHHSVYFTYNGLMNMFWFHGFDIVVMKRLPLLSRHTTQVTKTLVIARKKEDKLEPFGPLSKKKWDWGHGGWVKI